MRQITQILQTKVKTDLKHLDFLTKIHLFFRILLNVGEFFVSEQNNKLKYAVRTSTEREKTKTPGANSYFLYSCFQRPAEEQEMAPHLYRQKYLDRKSPSRQEVQSEGREGG